MKEYRTGSGVGMDSTFAEHRHNCTQCDRAPLAVSSAALAQLCLEGSVLWKRENVVTRQRKPAEREYEQGSLCDTKRVSMKQAKAAMRYK